jgi:hypothetical protein
VVTTTPGSGWKLDAGNSEDRTATITASGSRLSIDSGRRHGWIGWGAGRDVWRLTLPTSRIDDLSLVVSAGQGDIDLTGADLGRLELITNAGETSVDLARTSVATLSGTVNAGKLSIELPCPERGRSPRAQHERARRHHVQRGAARRQ